jgi:hypothetical protein
VARRDFHFAGHAFRVEADERPLLWLHEFVAPQFAVRDIGQPDQTIRFIVDRDEHARLAGHGPHAHQRTIACFTLDSGIVRARVWDVPGAGEVVFDDERQVFYRRWPSDPSVVEIIAAHDAGLARVALMRVVREYAMLYAARAGWLMLHAAAVCVEGNAFVIAGPKRAGKTTVLLHALCNEKGAYVSNDRVALQSGPSGLTVHGIPTIMSIRKESTAWFGDLDARLGAVRYDARRTVADRNAEGEVTVPMPARPWSLSPGQLCHLLGVESRASARVAAVLFPRVEASTRGTSFQELEGEQTLDAWRGALFRSCPPDGMFRIGDGVDEESEAAMGELPAGVPGKVPSILCSLGPDAYRDGARWLSSLLRR